MSATTKLGDEVLAIENNVMRSAAIRAPKPIGR